MLVDLTVVALAAAFVVSAVESLVELPFLRGLTALVAAGLGTWLMGFPLAVALVVAPAAAFLALLLVLVGERLATPPPVALERTRRGL